ncbi:Cyclin-dependent kinase 1 [Taenia solium]|eukprot:TsM_000131000 transcript=TsM_000131000 gene=TsM_000131000
MLQVPRYCHLRRIVYRDLTLQNVSIDANRSVVKLADFGLPKSFDHPLLTLTHGILLGKAVDCCGVDVWSMDCMFVEMTMGDPLFCEATWSDVTNLPYYNPGWVPTWHADRLCSQEKIMRALDARGPDLLTTLLHPYFANLDNRSLPAIGEEHIGRLIGRIPPDFAKLFNALVNII